MKQATKGVTRGISRRELGVAIAASAVTSAMAQQPPAVTQDLAAAAREQVKTNSETLRKFEVPTATEPSFVFRP
jgi:hypothetical protein